MIKKKKYVCYGCGKDRPCFVETNQEQNDLVIQIEDLKCILDETNQTGYKWEWQYKDMKSSYELHQEWCRERCNESKSTDGVCEVDISSCTQCEDMFIKASNFTQARA